MEEVEEKDLIDFKQYIRILSKFWYVAVFILLCAFALAYYKVRYAQPVYMVSTTMQIKDKSSYSYGSKTFLEGSSMFQPFKNLKNEIEIIKSYNRIQSVIKELDFMWEYVIKGNIRDIELYNTAPVKIEVDSSLIVTNIPISVTIIDSQSFFLSVNIPYTALYDPLMQKYTDTYATPVNIERNKYFFGQKISIGLFTFKINKTGFYNDGVAGKDFYITSRDLHYLTKVYKSKINIVENDKSSIISISSTGPVIAKEVAFLSKISEVYVRKELEDKNMIANNTINFIDSQLRIISDSLNLTDNNIQEFRKKHKIYDISQQSEMVLDQLNDLESKQLEAELQLRYYEYLKNYLNTDKELTELVAPSTINITEGILNKLVNDLIALYQQKNTLKYTSSEKSPAYQTILIRIRTTKEALLETTDNLVSTSRSSILDLKNRIVKLEGEMSSIPNKQRAMIDIERKHTINDDIYNYLLQKRAEASIARASNLPDAFTVESAREDEFIQIAPTVNKIYVTNIASGVGLIILLLIVYGKFDNKIHSKEDIVKITKVPVIGSIEYIYDHHEGNRIIHSRVGSLTESFRSIRTNLQFILQGKSSFMIGITSCISGDGKSFCSENLARIYAMSGKKTLLIRGDLRKKFIDKEKHFPENAAGLSEHLVGMATLEKIIHKDDIESLYTILPGPTPPNASELFASAQMDEFIKKVKTQFEVIIMDSPPVGLVSDYKSVLKNMDVNLYVVRYDYTQKESLEAIRDLKNTYTAANHFIIFNGITDKLLRKYSYYGNAAGYGSENIMKKPLWKRVLNKS